MASSQLDVIKTWKVLALKQFCRKKGLKVIGSKEELVARVFAGMEQELPDVLSDAEELVNKAKTYQSLLTLPNGTKLPDPFTELLSGWINEEKGRSLWPPTMYCDICEFFFKLSGDINRSITKRVLNDYKEGKAFSYFDSNWLKQIYYHPISDESVYCFLKATCTPSQRISHTPHQIWIAMRKKSGEIISAYCTCFAGLGATCNHIAAVLFKLDYFFRQGLTNKACTDTLCTWNAYGSDKTVLKPTLAKDLNWRKPLRGKEAEKKPCLVERKIDNHDPFNFEYLCRELHPVCANAVVFQSYSDVSPQDIFYTEINTSAPKAFGDLMTTAESESDILFILNSYKKDDITVIERETRGQNKNELWKQHRRCRITSSIVHDVYTRVQSLKSSCKELDVSSILKRVVFEQNANYESVPQLKYGREMESEARNSYQSLMSQNHSSFCVSDVGLVIFGDKPQFAASPDGVVTCLCCGTGLVEIKCPMSISHTCPTDSNLPYLYLKDNSLDYSLKKNHRYFSQIQWQIGIGSYKWCDFFVYTRHGYHLERIMFDSVRFAELLNNCEYFFLHHVIPFVLKSNMKSLPDPNLKENMVVSNNQPISTDVSCSAAYLNGPLQKATPPAVKKRRTTTRQNSSPVYICGICSGVCLSEEAIEDDKDNSVLCDGCLLWYHVKCVNYQDEEGDSDWFCLSCK